MPAFFTRFVALSTTALVLSCSSARAPGAKCRDQSIIDGPVAISEGRDIAVGAISGVSALDARDLDGDGDLDVGVFEGGAHADGRVTFAWFEAPSNPGSGAWLRRELTRPPNMRPFIGAAKFGDVDGDGDFDLVVTMDNHSNAAKSAYVYWLENPRPAASAATSWLVREVAANLAVHHVNDMELADMDGDGKLDVVTRSLDANQLHIYFQNGKTAWTEKVIDSAPYGTTGEGFALANIDGQGLPDISICGHWLKAPAAPRSQSYTSLVIDAAYASVNQNTKEDVGDIDGDGRLDVIISPAEGHRGGGNHVLAWYRNPENPSASSSWQRTVLADNLNGAHTVKLADMDGDRDLDVVSAVSWNLWGQTRSIKIYFNQGAGRFGAAQTVASGRGLYSGVVRDLEGDGDLDIFGQDYYSEESRPYLYESREGRAAPAPTCTDGTRNQGELGVDCGGPCPACAAAPQCGNGKVEQGEQCDDGNGNDADACRTNCRLASDAAAPSVPSVDPEPTGGDAEPTGSDPEPTEGDPNESSEPPPDDISSSCL